MGSAEWFHGFAEHEAKGSSATYEMLARGVADDAALCERLDRLPPGLQQPNLLFSVVRLLAGPTDEWTPFRSFVEERWSDVDAVLRQRSVQTNEAARCGSLLPVLAALPQPLALIEVGASAGLCLIPDRYQYSYDGVVVGPPSTVHIPVRCAGPVPVPDALPDVAFRAGIDLRPIDVTDDDDVAWLRACIWPEHDHRRARLDAAISLARDDPPEVVAGDLSTDLAPLLERAAGVGTTVVFHSAVLAYCTPAQRRAFAEVVTSRPDVVWVSNEVPGVVPGLVVEQPVPAFAPNAVAFAIGVGGVKALARADGHGTWLAWNPANGEVSRVPERV